uniref:beta-N-acetylhexosaminidase n=1 Tax=Steinernema glaseri TaxID=37863 RepID=A0A1I8A939_9BILA
MNLLHWHLVDSESFPYESRTFPELSEKGAYSPRHVYSQKHVAEVIEHARLRGKTDLPNLVDPTKPENFAFLEKFFSEITEVFEDDFLHLGGDEVTFWIEECWSRNPKIRDFMEQHGFGNSTVELENYYFSKLEKVLSKVRPKGKRVLYWQEVFDQNKPPVDAIVHVWKGNTFKEQMDEMEMVTSAGHQAILSSCWYLNYIHYGPDWMEGEGKYYYCDPRGFNATDDQKELVLGGIVAMWGEYVDATNIEARTWPRASAAAERLWSDPEHTKSAEEAWPRLHEFRCRMVARGFRAEPNNAPDFCPQEWEEVYPAR